MKNRLRVEDVGRVVVRGANWVGDAVMTVPALRELRRLLPDAHITLATRPWAEGVFDGADFLDDLLVIPEGGRGPISVWGQAGAWRSRRFDLAVIFPNSFGHALVAALARVPARVGYATAGRSPLLTHALPIPEWRGLRHEVYYYLNIISGLERLLTGAASEVEPRAELLVTEKRKREAHEFLKSQGVKPDRPLVALCPGSTNSRAKRWPAERFAALADILSAEAGAQVLLIGSREEAGVSSDVSAAAESRPFDLTGRTELALTAALLSVADLLVTNDTGPAHIADAVGCPVVAIFGPTNPVTTRPFSPRAVVVREPPECAPCMLRDCPIDHRCMTAVSTRAVYDRAIEMLEKKGVLTEVSC